jgi:glutathione S-transferase
MADLTLYTHKMSRGRIIRWMLEELGEPFDIKYVEYGAEMKSSEYLAINPMGKVPALKHGEGIVTETGAILTYLAETFASKGLIPGSGTPARAAFYRWMFFIAGPLEAATSNTFLQLNIPKITPLGTPSKGYLGYGSVDLTLKTLENYLKANTYLCGEQFTAADIYLASHIGFGMHIAKAYAPRDIFKTYLERLSIRPAKLRAEAP